MSVPVSWGAASSPVPPAAGTIACTDIIPKVRKWLEDEPWEDSLSADVADTTVATMTVLTPARWQKGDVVEFVDGEQGRVKETANGANPVPIKRAHNDTTAATHSSGQVILHNPRFTYDEIDQAITDAVSELFPSVWAVATTTVTPSLTTTLYDLPSDYLGLLGATQQSSSSITEYRGYGTKGGLPIFVDANLPTTAVSSTFSFKFPAGFYHPTNAVNIFYRAKITCSNIPDDDVAHIVTYDACARLLGAKEVPFVSNARGPAETNVTPGSQTRTALWFERQADKARAKVKSRLWMTQRPARVWRG